ncbi:ecto-ADP-ribosyltransferase 5 isoform X6 [Macaca fascicularis]|uniref:ecto-ADP-ribosyltransferase 5 isoform X6 n=1 Tax=Macaca fascicularis TaxID=9541 RepID=UPI0032B05431
MGRGPREGREWALLRCWSTWPKVWAKCKLCNSECSRGDLLAGGTSAGPPGLVVWGPGADRVRDRLRERPSLTSSFPLTAKEGPAERPRSPGEGELPLSPCPAAAAPGPACGAGKGVSGYQRGGSSYPREPCFQPDSGDSAAPARALGATSCSRPPQPSGMALASLMMALGCLGLHTWQAQAVPILPLGLAPDTFDDAYVGCAEEMEEKAAPLLKAEMAHHALLRESWEAAQEAWEDRHRGLTLPPGFKAQNGIAIMVYTNSSNTLYWKLNQAVRTGGGSRELYMRHFPFKALHFYLIRALQLLRGGGGCSTGPGEVVFRGVGSLRFEPKRLGDSVRLGQFASSSLDKAVACRFGNATLFSLTTCFGAPIQAFSVFPKEREVLIPPHEVFLVTRFSQDGAQSLVTLWSYNQTCSHFNCAYLGGEKRRGCVSAPGVQPVTI